MEKGTIGRLLDYYFENPEFEGEIKRAFEEFFSIKNLQRNQEIEASERERAFFHEWFVYNFHLNNNKTPIEDFPERNPSNWSENRLRVYQHLQENEYGILEVLGVQRGEGLRLRNLNTKRIFDVKEYTAALELFGGELFFGRIGSLGDHYELVGADPIMLPREVKEELMTNELVDMELNPKVVRDLFLVAGIRI